MSSRWSEADAVVKVARVGIWLAAYIAACLVFTSVRDGPLFIAALPIFAIVGTAQKLHAVARRELATSKLSLCQRVLTSLVLPLIGGVLAFFGSPGGRFFGVAIGYLGVGLFVEQLRHDRDFPRRWPLVLGASGALTLLGLAILAVSGSASGVIIAGVGILSAPVGVSLASEAAIRWLDGRSFEWEWGPAALGAILFACGILALRSFGVRAEVLAWVGGVILVLVVAMAARSNVDIVFVIAMAAVVWVLAARAVPLPNALDPEPHATIGVALGDSYMSGEGADQFFEGTNTKDVLACRRAPTAFPALLTLEGDPFPESLYFKACSGDRIEGVMRQLEEYDDRQETNHWDVGFALLNGGGNDVLFGDIGRTCLLPGDCTELGRAWRANLQEVEDELIALYGEAKRVLPVERIHVLPYPIPIRHEGCPGSTFTNDEHHFLHDFTLELDSIVQRATAKAELAYVDSMVAALARGNSRICDGPAGEVGVNFLAANGVEGTLEQSVNPRNWFHNSLHPNARGHELLRGALVQWMVENPEPPPADAPDEDVTANLFAFPLGNECMGDTGKELVACGYRWALRATGRLLLTKGLFALLLLFGAWLVAIPAIRRWRIFYGVEDVTV